MTDPIRIGGFYAPFDTESVIQQLTRVREIPLLRMDTNKALAEARAATLADIESRFISLRTRLQGITGALSVSGKTAKVDGAGVTASAGPTSATGAFTVEVLQLATGTRAVGNPVSAGVNNAVPLADSGIATSVTAGSFSINGVSIAVDPTVDTLDDVIARVNSSGAGVTASLANDSHGRPNVLSLTSGSAIMLGTGADTSNFLAATNLLASPGDTTRESTLPMARMRLTDNMADTAWLSGPPAAGPQSFTINGVTIGYDIAEDSLTDVMNRINASGAGVTARYDPVSDSLALQQTKTGSIGITLSDVGTGDFLAKTGLLGATQQLGQNAQYKIDGGPTQYADSNSVQVGNGASVTFTAVTDAPAVVTVGQNTTAAVDLVKAFVTDYNATMTAIASATKADGSKENNQSGLLSGDTGLRMMASTLRGMLTSPGLNVEGTYSLLSEVGLSFGKFGAAVGSTNTLQFDEAKFKQALETDAGSVQALFSTTSNAASLEAGGTSSILAATGTPTTTKPGKYQITDDGAGNLTVVFTPSDGTAQTTSNVTVQAGTQATNVVPGMTLDIAATLQAGSSTITVMQDSASVFHRMQTFIDRQAGAGGVLARRQETYTQVARDIARRQDELAERIDNEMDRLRQRFSAMEQAQARAAAILGQLTAMNQQLAANSRAS
jgi:flagellar hook-associated protein 2